MSNAQSDQATVQVLAEVEVDDAMGLDGISVLLHRSGQTLPAGGEEDPQEGTYQLVRVEDAE